MQTTSRETADAADVRDHSTLPALDMRCLAKAGIALDSVSSYSADDIKALRGRLGVSQAVLAVVLNTSRSAVRQWEQGTRVPTGSALRLLQVVDKKGLAALF